MYSSLYPCMHDRIKFWRTKTSDKTKVEAIKVQREKKSCSYGTIGGSRRLCREKVAGMIPRPSMSHGEKRFLKKSDPNMLTDLAPQFHTRSTSTK